ncbi:MAG: hypothetical protein CV090_09795 [Nitrospira sp. WS238]|nr:hypothetical protein [Nitrospira sp. WS238]
MLTPGKPDWAERKAASKRDFFDGRYVLRSSVAKLLRQEHTRAVRAVKRFISEIEFEIRYGSGDHHRTHAAKLKLANDILAALKNRRT